MDAAEQKLQRADRLIWTAITIIAVIDLIAANSGTFNIAWPTFLVPIMTLASLTAAGVFYRSIRRDNRAASLLIGTAQIIGFTAVAAPLSYIAARAGFPLQDATLAAWDRWLGVDWHGYVAFVTSRAWLYRLLTVAYASFAVQIIATVLALGGTGQLVRLNVFLRAFMFTSLVTIGISAFAPATGPWLFYDIQPHMAHGNMPVSSTSWPVFMGLRDGTFNTLSGLNSEGIITFPSLHAALAVMFVIAVWRVRGLRWVSLAINSLMLLATPVDGSHHVSDIIAGVGIAPLCWKLAEHSVHAQRISSEIIPQIGTMPPIVPDLVPEAPVVQRSQEVDRPKSTARRGVI